MTWFAAIGLLAFATTPAGMFYPEQYCVHAAPDIDGDGTPDVFLGLNGYVASIEATEIRDAGRLLVLSGKDGSVLRTTMGLETGDLFGFSVATSRDLNADGVADYWVGVPGMKIKAVIGPGELGRVGGIQLRSGKDGSVLRTHRWAEPCRDLGADIRILSDVDGDGEEDLCVSSETRTVVAVVSSKTGKVLWSAPTDEWPQPQSVAIVPDMDHDSVDEVLVGLSFGDHEIGDAGGGLRIHSGKTGKVIDQYLGNAVLPKGLRFTGTLSDVRIVDGKPMIMAQVEEPKRHANSVVLISLSKPVTAEVLKLVDQGDQPLAGRNRSETFDVSMAWLQYGPSAREYDAAVSAPYWESPHAHGSSGGVLRYSPTTKKVRSFVIPGTPSGDCTDIGDTIGALPDLDGDGVGDFFVASWQRDDCMPLGKCELRVLSGKSGKSLWWRDIDEVTGVSRNPSGH